MEVCTPEYRELLVSPSELRNATENIARKEFGFPAIGEGWIGETLLYNVVRALFPNDEIIRHHRPEWLGGLELDIYIPSLRLGIEYQGVQHDRPAQWWGGEAALVRQKERDRRKARLCESAGIRLMAFRYTEAITETNVARRIGSLSSRTIPSSPRPPRPNLPGHVLAPSEGGSTL